jgi:spore coat polysaccharide biosynthesis protein SpsF
MCVLRALARNNHIYENTRKERTVAFVVARLSSSRLPAKHLRTIGDRPMLQWVVDQLRHCKDLDDIVLATVAEAENRPLQEFAEKNGMACFWYEGEVDHVTTRLRRAAEAFDADICVLVSADCPLIHAPTIDRLIRSLKENPDADTVRLSPDSHGQPSALQGIVASRKKAWQLADNLADRPELKEHQFPVIGLRPELFHPVDVMSPDFIYMPPHRLSVDTLADLTFMNALYDELEKRNLTFDLPHVVALLKDQPALKQINAHVHQRRLVEKIIKVLFILDAGGRYGFGHLMRCLELARQITERLGWPAHFLIDDQQAESIIEKTGCKTHWGAFGRPANQNRRRDSSTVQSITSAYDLLVFDIFDQRGPQGDWRSDIGKEKKCVVIENMQSWTNEADLIVLPNLLDKHPFGRVSQNDLGSPDSAKSVGPKVIGGESFVILRNEIRRFDAQRPTKEIDVLVYLHDDERRQRLKKMLASMSLKVKVTQDFASGFAEDLARARVFVSSFGISFNEALALETLPVCWPDSDAHREDATRFYRNLDMEPLIVDSAAEIESVISTALKGLFHPPKPIQDGTPNIIAEIAALF